MTEQPAKGEMLAEKVERLTRELDGIKRQMAGCRHKFGEPKVTLREVVDAHFVRYEGKGSDPEPVFEYTPRQELGWTRTCNECGQQQYTADTKPIVAGYEPKFD